MLSPNKPLRPASKKKISFSQGHWICRERTPHYQGSPYLCIEWSLWQGCTLYQCRSLVESTVDWFCFAWQGLDPSAAGLCGQWDRLRQVCRDRHEGEPVRFGEIVMTVSLLSGLLRLSWKWASVRFVEIVVKVSLCQVCWNCHKGESLLGLLRLS